jgi:hypothetical protein
MPTWYPIAPTLTAAQIPNGTITAAMLAFTPVSVKQTIEVDYATEVTTADPTGNVWADVISQSVTTTGGYLVLYAHGKINNSGGDAYKGQLRITVDGTQKAIVATSGVGTDNVHYVDYSCVGKATGLAAGTYTVKLQVRNNYTDGNSAAKDCSLLIQEIG